jgi:hypothetical protein
VLRRDAVGATGGVHDFGAVYSHFVAKIGFYCGLNSHYLCLFIVVGL